MATEDLTVEEQATNAQTQKHIRLVGKLLHMVAVELLRRADAHDQSKLERPEVELFTEFTTKLATCTYGSPEYEAFRRAMGPALAHHYANNDHHPEHFKDGIDDMNLVQLVEMFCDWKASSTRHNDGNIRKSIEVNANRFGMSPQLVRILENTAAMFDGVK
jgi:hypothetical protein